MPLNVDRSFSRRRFLGLSISTTALVACQQIGSNSPSTTFTTKASNAKNAPQLRLGFQPPYVTVFALRDQQLFEKTNSGQSAEYIRMLSLKPVTEALAAGAIDLGIGGPPIAAIAAGLPIQIVALVERSPKTHAILVRPDSSIKSGADLRGKKVGTPLGKSHLLVLRVLEQAGLKDTDIEWAQLENDVGRAALTQGAIDAWATWDPFYASVETAKEAVPIVDGDGHILNYVAIFGRTEYLKQYPETVQQFLKSYKQAVTWVNTNRSTAAEILARENKLSLEAATLTLNRRNFIFGEPNAEFREDVIEQGKLLLKLKITQQEPDWNQAIDTTLAQAVES
jgi:sulfonate transport system substrate-binding protein